MILDRFQSSHRSIRSVDGPAPVSQRLRRTAHLVTYTRLLAWTAIISVMKGVSCVSAITPYVNGCERSYLESSLDVSRTPTGMSIIFEVLVEYLKV